MRVLPLLYAVALWWTPIVGGAEVAWPPVLQNADVNGVVEVKGPALLRIPPEVEAAAKQPGAAAFDVAKVAPRVRVVLHPELPGPPTNATGWSSWGAITVASDGVVYSAIGNHGRNDQPLADQEDGGATYLYAWEPGKSQLRRVVDLNTHLGIEKGDPSWSKIHSGIHEGADGGIYFTATLNNGANAFKAPWNQRVPGGQLYRYDPASGECQVVATFPGEVSPTTLLDRERHRWIANFEGKTGPKDIALTLVEIPSGRLIFQSPHDWVTASRNLALARDGTLFFNGEKGLWRFGEGKAEPTGVAFSPEGATMRSSTQESREGVIYGTTMRPGSLFAYRVADAKLTSLGPDFLSGDYTVVTLLSPDERYLYYLPGAHGGALKIGTPVVQYEIATGRQKVLAFLRDAVAEQAGYFPAGTYGIALSANGSTLFINFNGQLASGPTHPKQARGFGQTGFVIVEIPVSERE